MTLHRFRNNPILVLDLESRKNIYNVVMANAGSHMREIQRASGMSFGLVSYHLSYLAKYNLIKEARDGNHIRYYPITFDINDERLLALLRQRSVRTILLFILTHEGCSHQEICSEVHLSPSTITWHLNKLIDGGIVISDKKSNGKTYSLVIPKERIIKLLITYRESFLDNLVEGLLTLWE
jgi:predicted transcriptional regulator